MTPIPPQRDWREDYIVCAHIADGSAERENIRHAGFRCCCAACWEIQDEHGVPLLLYAETAPDGPVVVEERGRLSVMSLAQEAAR